MVKFLKWFSILLVVLVAFTLFGVIMAENAPTPTQSKTVSENQSDIDIMQVVNKTPQEVEKILGKPSSLAPMDSVNNPGTFKLADGNRVKAEQGIYDNEGLNIKIVYIEGKAGRVTVNFPSARYKFPDELIKVLELTGLPTNNQPTFSNEFTHRWEQSIQDLFQVAIFADGSNVNYLYIITKDKYK